MTDKNASGPAVKKSSLRIRSKQVDTIRIFCVCGKRMELMPGKADYYPSSYVCWRRYCNHCRRHIQLLVSCE